ncbi:MAG: nitroreductase family protein [Leptolyngbyaceae cyanobacterium MO_188.B28]|nr:nitroreductase family protein [Leptolyngbyaceae cyanobacterium MO_188.B28]
MLKEASPDYVIHELLAKRWSPYGFQSRSVAADDLRSLFEAARWSASSFNEQPWRFIVATQADAAEFEKMLSCLAEPNQVWAKVAPVLALGVAKLDFSQNGKPNRVAIYDLGAAACSLTFEATARGLMVHQMAGILPDKARELYQVPEGFDVITALAIGYAADPESLSDRLKERDQKPRQRKPLSEFVFDGEWGTASAVIS